MEETNRQKKIGGVLQKDLADVIQQELRNAGKTNIIISVSKVKVTTDLSIAKAYLSIFPSAQGKVLIEELREIKHRLKHQVALRTKHQLRKMPDLDLFFG